MLVPLWIAAAVVAVVYLPSTGAARDAFQNLPLPRDAPPVRAEALSKREFPFPLISRYVVVQHNEDGLTRGALREAADTALDVRKGRLSEEIPGLAAVVPVPNVALEPGARPTTILYYLYFRRGTDGIWGTYRFSQEHIAPRAGGRGRSSA